jgi:hypothetical protein
MMSFDHFLDICGGSFFPEEYRGNLDVAWQELQRCRPKDFETKPQVTADAYVILRFIPLLKTLHYKPVESGSLTPSTPSLSALMT